jgi:hypothetical protein
MTLQLFLPLTSARAAIDKRIPDPYILLAKETA